ncbi:MAG: peptidylprolyl isomerase [Thermodesulfobacteriota bacterium]
MNKKDHLKKALSPLSIMFGIRHFKILIALFLVPVFVFVLGCERSGSDKREPEQGKQGQEAKVENSTETVNSKGGNPMVLMSTSMGDIKIELYPAKAPVTVENFLGYVRDGFYDGTIFHRVIPGFMIQGGGFTPDMNQKPTKESIKNEADNGLKNDKGTIAMARTNVVDSATSQFFINEASNDFLNHGSRDFGYAVFGKVVEGMDVVDKIAVAKTGSVGMFQDVPKESIVIESVKVLGPEAQ